MIAGADAYVVARTMAAMEALVFRSATASEVASALQVHPRTARRLLNRLVDDGWLTRSDGQRRLYAPTLRVVALAAQYAERVPLAVVALPAIEQLRTETGAAAAHLSIPSYRSTLCLVHCGSQQDARPGLRELTPAHATAAGKVLLAHRPEWRESVFDLPLERVTDRTLTEPAAHREQATDILDRGYGWDEQELDERVSSIAAPVADPGGDVIAAVSVSLCTPMLGEQEVARLGACVAKAADRVSSALSEAATSTDSGRGESD